jgi:hypothetical protein
VDDQHRIILKLFSRAAHKVGSVAHLGVILAIPYGEVNLYLQGKAIPPEEILLRLVTIILDDLPEIRRDTSAEAWESLRLPK